MLRMLFSVSRQLSTGVCRLGLNSNPSCGSHMLQFKNIQFSQHNNSFKFGTLCSYPSLLETKNTWLSLLQPQKRTVTKYSLQKGKRKTVKAVIHRFYRLHWGIWIRTRAGHKKSMWKKKPKCKRRAKEHVFCNATQSYLLDKMVTKFWRKPKYYVDDPYNPYHTREEFKHTAVKPRIPLKFNSS